MSILKSAIRGLLRILLADHFGILSPKTHQREPESPDKPDRNWGFGREVIGGTAALKEVLHVEVVKNAS